MVRYRHFFRFFPLPENFPSDWKCHTIRNTMLNNCAKKTSKIGDVFKKINKGKDQSSEIKSEVRQVLDYIITEVCNEVEIDNLSKTKEVSSPQVLITHSETATMRICSFNHVLTDDNLNELVHMFKGLKDRRMDL